MAPRPDSGSPLFRSRQEPQLRVSRARVLLDTGRTMAGLVDGVPRLGHGLDACLCLTAVAARLGDRVGLVAFADRLVAVVPPGSRRDQLSRVTAALYALEPVLAQPQLDRHWAYSGGV